MGYEKLTKTAERFLQRRKRPKDSFLLHKIEKIKKEIVFLNRDIWNLEAKDLQLRLEQFKTQKSETIRVYVISTFLGIEDLLKPLLFDAIRKTDKIHGFKEIKKTIEEIKSRKIIEWCGILGIISKKQYKDLLILNLVRNSCAHNWTLNTPKLKIIKKNGMRKRRRVPRIIFHNKNLMDEKVFRQEFLPVYSKIYLDLLSRLWRVQGLM